MNSPMWSVLFGLFLVAHGVGHTAGFAVGPRAFAGVWMMAFAGFLAAGLAFFGTFLTQAWWRPLAIASAILSTAAIVVFWPPSPGPKLNALVANVGILLAILWWRWPALRTGP